jgi:RpiR family transcriptional regulator, carbohydrate utilization regulator
VDGALSPGANGAAADLLDRLATRRAGLSRSEARVAEIILDHPDAVPRMTLAALAERAGVSEPTVVRFCRSLGVEGYADFKLELARARAAGGAAYLHREISFADGVPTVWAKVFQSSIKALAVVQETLDPDLVSRAVDLLAAAPRIDCVGVGLSAIVAIDAQQKLMRLEVHCAAHHDAHLQTMSAATLRPGDAALVFSYNGRIKDVLRCAAVAREAGAATIAVTRSGTPLAAAVDVCIPVDVPEDTFVYAPMTTRLAQLAVLDVLATGVALRRGPAIAAHLERVKETMSDQWLVAETPRANGRRRTHRSREAKS